MARSQKHAAIGKSLTDKVTKLQASEADLKRDLARLQGIRDAGSLKALKEEPVRLRAGAVAHERKEGVHLRIEATHASTREAKSLDDRVPELSDDALTRLEVASIILYILNFCGYTDLTVATTVRY